MAKNKNALRTKNTDNESQATHMASRWPAAGWRFLGLLCAGLAFGALSHAEADPSGAPTADHVFFNCTFTTADLQSILSISQPNLALLNGTPQLTSGQVLASYILIYVRENPNDGQKITNTSTYTGPILCINSDNNNVFQTNEGTAISGSIDILGAEESSHIQIQPHGSTNTNDRQKRVCHTVASNTDCFTIQSSGGLQ